MDLKASPEFVWRFLLDSLHALERAQNDVVTALTLLGDKNTIGLLKISHTVDVARIKTVLANWKA